MSPNITEYLLELEIFFFTSGPCPRETDMVVPFNIPYFSGKIANGGVALSKPYKLLGGNKLYLHG